MTSVKYHRVRGEHLVDQMLGNTQKQTLNTTVRSK